MPNNKDFFQRILSIFQKTECPCCNKFKYMSSLKCSHKICSTCLKRMSHYADGAIFEEWRHLCPLCREPIPYAKDKFSSQLDNKKIDPNMMYRFCSKPDCGLLFCMGSKSCATSISVDLEIDANKYCYEHSVNNIFKCPKCKSQLEFGGGCREMVCCLYGADFCKATPGCKHGGLCGYKWLLGYDQFYISPDLKEIPQDRFNVQEASMPYIPPRTHRNTRARRMRQLRRRRLQSYY